MLNLGLRNQQKGEFLDGPRGRPNLSLKSDCVCIAFHSLSSFRYLGSAHRLGAGGAGELPSLGATNS
jgi:hypothetical protein